MAYIGGLKPSFFMVWGSKGCSYFFWSHFFFQGYLLLPRWTSDVLLSLRPTLLTCLESVMCFSLFCLKKLTMRSYIANCPRFVCFFCCFSMISTYIDGGWTKILGDFYPRHLEKWFPTWLAHACHKWMTKNHPLVMRFHRLPSWIFGGI